MDPGVEALGRFWIDINALADDAAECRLDMGAGAAEAVIKVEMAKGSVHVVPPHQTHHPAAKPDTFRVAGRAGHETRGFGKFVDLTLGVLGGVGRLDRRRLVAAFGIAALSVGMLGSKHRRRREKDGEAETQQDGHGRTG